MTQTWPPSKGLTTQRVPRADVVLPSYGSARIKAPAAQVFEILRDVGRYGEWNTFCPKVEVHSQPEHASDSALLNLETVFTLYAVMNSAKPDNSFATYLHVTDFSTPQNPSSYVPASILNEDGSYTADLQKVYRIAWAAAGNLMSRGLRTERFHEVIVLSDNECEVRTWECQGGVLAHTVKWMYKKVLMEKFQTWCDELKKYSESKLKETA